MSHEASPQSEPRRILVIGAYGLIGQGIVRQLLESGHSVTGMGRDLAVGVRVFPDLPWVQGDLRNLIETRAWEPVLAGFHIVVNCSGALQDGGADDLASIHHHAVKALASQCVSQKIQLIQISSVGSEEDAETKFLSTKGLGDAAIRSSGAPFQILRPGLVISESAYGGTALLRMLAAFPIIQPIALPDSEIQTVSLKDVANVVNQAVEGNLPDRFECDLVEAEPRSLRALLGEYRDWLGFGAAKLELVLPNWSLGVLSFFADMLAHLGWRSPLRTTALKVLQDGVRGNANGLIAGDLPKLAAFPETLRRIPVGVEQRMHARMMLLFPLVMIVLIAFWLFSGLIGILQLETAARVLVDAGWSQSLAVVSVFFWSVVDIGIAVSLAFRKYAKRACWAAVFVSLFYLLASFVVAPWLWLDPLGPLVKVLPEILLALVARIGLESR